MRRIGLLMALTIGLTLAAVRPARATAFGEVGTCDAPLKTFPTISAAVSAAPSGATIIVCPGVYPEQVTINKPLTLLGDISPKTNTARPVIAAPPPSQGLGVNVTSIFGLSFAAQVLVTAGPVNIDNITVDGTGVVEFGGGCVAGIFYASGSSGIVDAVTTRNQTSNSCSTGIWAENGSASDESVEIADSSVHHFDGTGIFAGSNQSPSTLAAIIKANGTDGGEEGIESRGAASSMTNNVVTSASSTGIAIALEGGVVTSNTVAKSTVGILVEAPASVSGNALWDNTTGIELLAATNMQLYQNRILGGRTAIEFNCIAPFTLKNNFLNDATTGFADVPSGFTLPFNHYVNVNQIKTVCGAGGPGQ